MAVPYLQIDNLTKSFGDLVLFENISFGIAEGQRVGLIAKNGSGKTTLLNIIAGKEGYDSGNIVFRRDLRVDYLEQDPQYPEELTVRFNHSRNGSIDTEIMVRRLNFPGTLQTEDPEQYSALVEALGGNDHGGTRLWWDTGNNNLE